MNFDLVYIRTLVKRSLKWKTPRVMSDLTHLDTYDVLASCILRPDFPMQHLVPDCLITQLFLITVSRYTFEFSPEESSFMYEIDRKKEKPRLITRYRHLQEARNI